MAGFFIELFKDILPWFSQSPVFVLRLETLQVTEKHNVY